MIYPESYPINNNNKAEKEVFNYLKKLNPKDYDIFHSRRFIATENGERNEYEADFIIADIRNGKLNAILIIEVKGGRVSFNGTTNQWIQNNKYHIDPVKQVTGIMHSLVNRYPDISREVPFGWAVCFPNTIAADETPTQIHPLQLMDSFYLQTIEKQIPELFNYFKERNPYRKGTSLEIYQNFKNSLLRGLGFVVPLHKQIALAEERFIELTNEQLELLKIVSANQNIFVTGPAGSGKTVMATTIAQEAFEEGKSVLLLTFNRILANNIRYNLNLKKEDRSRFEVATFHSIAKRLIDKEEPEWWREHSKEDDFWTLTSAVKLDEVLEKDSPKYDVLIIDEGQDFHELWFESLEKLLKPEGHYYVFMDKHQNIFNAFTKIPGNRNFLNFPLTKNCRNTKTIIDYLSQHIEDNIDPKDDTPGGEAVREITFKNDVEQLNRIKDEWFRLVDEEKIPPERIVIIFNAKKSESCIGKTRKFGKYSIEAVDRKTGKPAPGKVNYTTINTFKGLEADVVFIIDTDKVENPDYKILYTQASRAKYLLYILIKK
ncbi:nuclease-related domain-containing DEAD/DEAH box helicase [Marinilabilia salmonicolor]|uniref:DNA 3'-5' helicase II n=1 Tax=Marinilabilia salmonicolor TaxID=989 RepID=A0A368V6R4_9BACT|nr:UvrD-helicase domain-containing protein [Marinilabilia salmonicolor]RCW36782.1 UvrD-like helicase family protein [Marinilabilia salmonicolor]